MINDIAIRTFLDAARAWLCAEYYLDVRYIASKIGPRYEVWDASIAFNPLPPTADHRLRIEAEGFAFGQVQEVMQDEATSLTLLAAAAKGTVSLSAIELALPLDEAFNVYSEMSHRERWFSDLHIQISGARRPLPTAMELAAVDNALRLAQPPFDGLSDAAAWLGLRAPEAVVPSLNIRILPPVDLIFERCVLSDNTLLLTVHAHPRFDVTKVRLSIREGPGRGLDSRRPVADRIAWGDVRDGRREGIAEIALENADSVLVMLLIDASTVRRQWFIDTKKARNQRLLATQHFDKDLKMVRRAVLDSTDSPTFERGVASLLFLLGFSPALQLETDAPDLIVATPGGRLAVVECTTRIADFPAKVGKLVDRRAALTKHLASTGHPTAPVAVLICRLPRDQIGTQTEYLRAHSVILIAGEELTSAFTLLRNPSDPDKMLTDAVAQLDEGVTR